MEPSSLPERFDLEFDDPPSQISQSVPHSHGALDDDLPPRRVERDRPPSYESLFGSQTTTILAILSEQEAKTDSLPPKRERLHSAPCITTVTHDNVIDIRPRIPSAPPEVDVSEESFEMAGTSGEFSGSGSLSGSDSTLCPEDCMDQGNDGSPLSTDRLIKSTPDNNASSWTTPQGECHVPIPFIRPHPASTPEKDKLKFNYKHCLSRPKYVLLMMFVVSALIVTIIAISIWGARRR